jgi:MoaA/NifB/PqqE/SkfB family radical SAM enzyme
MNSRCLSVAPKKNTAVETKTKKDGYVNPLNQALAVFFKNAVSVSLKNPSQSLYFLEIVKNQHKSSKIRAEWQKKGIQVPPIMIISITNRCNLHCKGCYHQTIRHNPGADMSEQKLRRVFSEARDLGVSTIVLAGGEPMVREDILDITRDFPEILFLMFTNGLLISEEKAARFKLQKNIVPLISLEGRSDHTDQRRGEGVYSRLQSTIDLLNKHQVFFGTSLTLTRQNFTDITDEQFISDLTSSGCKFVLIAEYTPIQPDTENWVITEEQRELLGRSICSFRKKYSALFVSVPGDEKDFGGCLSAGRGFIHISAEGDVEPCPFAPYSDTNIRDHSLKEALQSGLLKAIRENENLGKENGGGCALFAQREWVQSLLTKNSNSIKTEGVNG